MLDTFTLRKEALWCFGQNKQMIELGVNGGHAKIMLRGIKSEKKIEGLDGEFEGGDCGEESQLLHEGHTIRSSG